MRRYSERVRNTHRRLEKYNPELLDKERILAISKSDMLDEELKEEINHIGL